MIVTRLTIVIVLLVSFFCVQAQKPVPVEYEGSVGIYSEDVSVLLKGRSFNIGDTVFILLDNCKNNIVLLVHKKYDRVDLVRVPVVKNQSVAFIKVHGNILYNFSYRSYIDTPFAQNDLVQHMVQTSLNFVVQDKYPVRMTITNRNSNSPYFKDITDVAMQFNRSQLLENIKEDFRNRVTAKVSTNALLKAEQLYADRQVKMQQLQAWLNSPARAQELVEEKERELRKSLPAVPMPDLRNIDKSSIAAIDLDGFLKTNKRFGKIGDSIEQKAKDKLEAATALEKPKLKDSSLLEKFNTKKEELTRLQGALKQDEARIRQVKKNVQDSISKVKRAINSVTNTAGLYSFMKNNGIPKNELTKAQRILLSVNQVGLGRTSVDYSELTVKNVSLAGVNIEMNPLPYYFAAAAGKVNYRFRDFILKNNRALPDQQLYLLRAGIGQKEKNNFILTFYNGRKSVLNYTPSNNPSSVQRVLGISAETRMAINENNYVIAEVAKSSYNPTAGTQPSSSELLSKVFKLKERTNLAYSLKLFSQNPATHTKLTAYYKKIGENFQSFNLYPTSVNQDAWMVRVNQYLWKRRFSLDAAIRKNDFVSPIAAPSFSNKTIFKSLQASVRIPKYPFATVGYYPSSQLSLASENVLVENQYNTLNAIVGHSYQLGKVGMTSNAVYTKFYNNSSDTGFIYFNASSWTVNHTVFLSPFSLLSSVALTDQEDLHLFTGEGQLSYQFKNILTLTAGMKWNRVNKEQNLFGAIAAMSIHVKKLGTLQFNYDKIYLPGYNRVLLPVDMGRMTFYRQF